MIKPSLFIMFHHVSSFSILCNFSAFFPVPNHQWVESLHLGSHLGFKLGSFEVFANQKKEETPILPLRERMAKAMKAMKSSSSTAMKAVKKPLQKGSKPLTKRKPALEEGKKAQCKPVTSEKGSLEQIGASLLD